MEQSAFSSATTQTLNQNSNPVPTITELQEQQEQIKPKVLLIGETHEIKSAVREIGFDLTKPIDPNQVLHAYVQGKVTRQIIDMYEELRRPISILFVNEGQDKNERNNMIIKNLHGTGITDKLSIIQEYSAKTMQDPKYKCVYYMSSFIVWIRLLETKRRFPTITFDGQYRLEMNQEYFLKMFFGHRLEQIIKTEDAGIFIELINIVVGIDTVSDYNQVFSRALDYIVGLFEQFIDQAAIKYTSHEELETERSILEMFRLIKTINITERVAARNEPCFYSDIMARLRILRDENLVKRINTGLSTQKFDCVVWYFGLNHFENQRRLITETGTMTIRFEIKMDEELCSRVSTFGSPDHIYAIRMYLSQVGASKEQIDTMMSIFKLGPSLKL